MASLQGEIQDICNKLTELIKAEIQKKGLVKTGKLLNSIRFIGSETNRGISFKMEAMDYYSELDNKYNITQDAYNSSKFKEIQDRIANIYVIKIEEDLSKNG